MALAKVAISATAFIALVSGHARITSPKTRGPGPLAEQYCGAGNAYKNLKNDLHGPLEGPLNKTYSDPNYDPILCPFFTCRGFNLEDNLAYVQNYSAGTEVTFHVDIVAHHTGYANMSVIDLKQNTEISRLLTWPVYADSTIPPAQWPKNESDFTATIPSGLADKCIAPGDCAIQWFWYATENHQTYVNCIDFVATS